MDYSRNGGASQTAAQHTQGTGNSKKSKGLNVSRVVSGMLIIAVAILAIALIAFVIFGGGKAESELIKKDKYQAIFLNDQSGQVYFGKLTVENARFYKLTDIYYVRVDSAVQPDKTNQSATQQNISLAKLGNELHGPEDVMYISRDKVLFWENLKEDGQVVKAITEFKKNGSTSTSNSSSTDTNASTNTNSTTNR